MFSNYEFLSRRAKGESWRMAAEYYDSYPQVRVWVIAAIAVLLFVLLVVGTVESGWLPA